MFSDALAAVASSVYKIGMGLLASVEASARELEAKTAELDVASLVFFVLSHKSFPLFYHIKLSLSIVDHPHHAIWSQNRTWTYANTKLV